MTYLINLARLINRGSFHGESFVLACAGADNVWRCEQLLRAAELAGLIERGRIDPTPAQRFFQIDRDWNATHCHWVTRATKWLAPRDLAVLTPGVAA